MPTLAFLLFCAFPCLWVFVRVILFVIFGRNYFGADPGMELVIFFGQIAIIFLFATLMVSNLGRIPKILGVPRMRRILGLSVFFYATLHLLSYFFFFAGLEFETYFQDLTSKKRLVFGSLAYFLLFFLAATSIDYAIRYLGKVWLWLHRLIYFVAGLVVLHVFLSAKENLSLSLFVFCVYLIFLCARLKKARERLKSRSPLSRAQGQ